MTDACLALRLEKFVTEHDCMVCGKTLPTSTNAPFAVPLEQLMDVLTETVHHFYADATSVLPWDSEDGSLVGLVSPRYGVHPVLESMPLTLQAGESDVGWRLVSDAVVDEAFSMELAAGGAFGDAGAGAVAFGRVGALQDFGDGVMQAGGESVRGKNPPAR